VPGGSSFPAKQFRFLVWSLSVEIRLITEKFLGFCAGSLFPAKRLDFSVVEGQKYASGTERIADHNLCQIF
jgi:glutamine amidotransferase-like uncharacterized protein